MEYFTINNKRIPVLGFLLSDFNNYNINSPLIYINDSIIMLNDSPLVIANQNNYLNLILLNNNNILIGLNIDDFSFLYNLNIKPHFIIINNFNIEIINYCKNNNILIIYFGKLLDINISNKIIKKYKKTKNQIIIRFLLDMGLIFISNELLNNNDINVFNFCLDNDDINFLINYN